MQKKELIRSLKFLLFSISAGLIQIGLFTVLNEWILPDFYWLSYLIALVASVIWNFTFNRRFTFQSAASVPKAMLLVFAYYCVFTPASTLLEHWLTVGCGWNEYLVTLLNMVINFITEFLWQRFVVFRNNIDNNEAAIKKMRS